MKQHINIEIIMEAEADISAETIEARLRALLSQIDSDRTGLISLYVKEEAEIYGNSEQEGSAS